MVEGKIFDMEDEFAGIYSLWGLIPYRSAAVKLW
jgi:hypothetical protein